MTDVTDNDDSSRRSRAIRNAVLLGVTALCVYGLYIFLVYRSGPAG
jgi:hypothetical protein